MFNRKDESEGRKQNVVGDIRLWDIEKKKDLFGFIYKKFFTFLHG